MKAIRACIQEGVAECPGFLSDEEVGRIVVGSGIVQLSRLEKLDNLFKSAVEVLGATATSCYYPDYLDVPWKNIPDVTSRDDLHIDLLTRGISFLLPLRGPSARFFWESQDGEPLRSTTYGPGDMLILRHCISVQGETDMKHLPQIPHAGFSDGQRMLLSADYFFDGVVDEQILMQEIIDA